MPTGVGASHLRTRLAMWIETSEPMSKQLKGAHYSRELYHSLFNVAREQTDR